MLPICLNNGYFSNAPRISPSRERRVWSPLLFHVIRVALSSLAFTSTSIYINPGYIKLCYSYVHFLL